MDDVVDNINRRTYARPSVVRCYDELNLVLKPEAAILERLHDQIKEKRLLDIGFGGGRTTKLLLDISDDYVGIDYTPALVEAAKKKFPHANLMCADARNLSRFDDESFDFVLFSFNGIDYMNHRDRLLALNDIHRVLKKGGHFAFSTHNRDFRDFNKQPWQQQTRRDSAFIKSSVYALIFLPRHLALKRHEVRTDEYAIINDNAHNFSLFTYYITIRQQRAQLERTGFSEIDAYDMDGKIVDDDEDCPWIYFLARKSS